MLPSNDKKIKPKLTYLGLRPVLPCASSDHHSSKGEGAYTYISWFDITLHKLRCTNYAGIYNEK